MGKPYLYQIEIYFVLVLANSGNVINFALTLLQWVCLC